MDICLYKGGFDGLLSAIFNAYLHRRFPESFSDAGTYCPRMFDSVHSYIYDPEKTARVKKAITRKCSNNTVQLLYRAYLTEVNGIENQIFSFIRKAMDSPVNIEKNFLDEDVLYIHQLNKKIRREVHRMHAFVRFMLIKDGIYFSAIEPDFNVIPLIGSHFQKRYADQEWVIFDCKRNYGLYYDLVETRYIKLSEVEVDNLADLPVDVLADEETSYQQAWKEYFESVNIKERKNLKLHLQHVPRRYWKYLTEKT